MVKVSVDLEAEAGGENNGSSGRENYQSKSSGRIQLLNSIFASTRLLS